MKQSAPVKRSSFFGNLVKRRYFWFAKLSMLAALSMTVINCAKQRDKKFLQGQGTDLENIKALDGKEFTLTTGDTIGQTHTSAAKTVVYEDGASFRQYPLVSYETKADLLGSVPFRGKANHQYTIRYELTKHHLRVLKIAAKDDIPYDEIAYSEQLSDGRYAVPMVGYKILSYYKVENQRNSYDEDTQYLVEIPVLDPSNASHVKVDYFSQEAFDAITKVDTYPSDTLVGNWYLAVADIAVSEAKRGGAQGDLHLAQKVRIEKRPNGYMVYDAAVDEILNTDDLMNLTPTLEIPATWHDYQVKKIGTSLSLSEEEVFQRDPVERDFAEIDFAGIIGESNLETVEFGKDYFSFTVLREGAKAQTKFAFLRANERSYVSKPYLEDDASKFGYFQVMKPTLVTTALNRDKDVDTRYMINRFDPKKDIVYHMSMSTPEWIVPVVQESIDAWDKAFQKAGTGMRVRLNTEKRVSLNDIRYNIVNIVDSKVANHLLGYGPMIADPMTGEAISATANVYINTYRAAGARAVHGFLDHHLDRSGKSLKIPVLDQEKFKTDLAAGQLGVPSDGFFKGVSLDDWGTYRYIKKECPYIYEYIESREGMAVRDETSKEELELVDRCADSLIKHVAKATLVHEIGHNIGLRHNFKGSADKPNFYPASESSTGEIGQSSSIMDYFDLNDETLHDPGLYDIAAVRYGYADTVETIEGGSFLKIADTTQSIEENFGENTTKEFLYCTDEDTIASDDLYCAKFDVGSTATEIVDSYIKRLERAYHANLYRNNRIFVPSLSGSIGNSMVNLRKVYDEWRIFLSRYMGDGQEYIPSQDANDMAAVIGKMEAAGGEYTKAVQDLLPASRQAYLAIKRMATLPNRFCVVSSGENNPIEYFSFSSLQKSIQGKTKESIDSCNHDAATAYFSSHGLAVVDEVGYHMETVKFKIGEEDVNRAPDIYGLDRTRSFALTSLLTRENLGEHPFAAYFGLGSSKRGRRIDANVVDEPDLRADLSNWILDRALNGIRFDEANEQGQNSNQMAGLFLDDKEFLSSFYSGFMSGLKTPEAITEDRHAPYKVYRAMGPDQEAKVTTSSWEHFYDSRNNLWYVKNAADNHLGKVIFDHYKKLSELEKALDVDPEKFADFEKSVEFFEDLSDLTVAEFQNTLSETLQGFDALPFSGQLKSSYLGQESPDNLFVYWTSIAGEKYREMRKAGSLSAAPAEAFQEFSAKKLSEVLAEDVIATVSQHYTATFEHALEETLGLADTADGELKIGNSSFAQEAFEAELDAQIGVLYQMMRANHMGGMSYHHF